MPTEYLSFPVSLRPFNCTLFGKVFRHLCTRVSVWHCVLATARRRGCSFAIVSNGSCPATLTHEPCFLNAFQCLDAVSDTASNIMQFLNGGQVPKQSHDPTRAMIFWSYISSLQKLPFPPASSACSLFCFRLPPRGCFREGFSAEFRDLLPQKGSEDYARLSAHALFG